MTGIRTSGVTVTLTREQARVLSTRVVLATKGADQSSDPDFVELVLAIGAIKAAMGGNG